MDLKVGQKIWLVKKSWSRIEEPKEVEINKVGRKYFEIEGYRHGRFMIETLIEDVKSNYKSRCYLTLQEILDEREISNLSRSIRSFLNGYGNINLELEKLRQINEIITTKTK